MSKQLRVREDITVEELYEKYKHCGEGILKTHWQMIWLKAQGVPTRFIAKATGYNTDWVRRVIRRYNMMGEKGIGDRRRNNGNTLMLTEQQMKELQVALGQRAIDGGLWNCKKVAIWLREKTGRHVHPQTGWEYLQRGKMSLQVPRPKHPETTSESIIDFKKNF